jgi:hypothetical protein
MPSADDFAVRVCHRLISPTSLPSTCLRRQTSRDNRSRRTGPRSRFQNLLEQQVFNLLLQDHPDIMQPEAPLSRKDILTSQVSSD